MKPTALLALTGHGNAPYLMAARFTQALGDHAVVIPWYYGQPQANILLEEAPQMRERIYLSTKLGELFAPLLLEAGAGKPFAHFGARLARLDSPHGAPAIENRLAAMLTDGIPAEPLTGEPARIFKAADFAAAVNTTLPVRVNFARTFFFFTARMSRLYGTAPGGEPDPQTTLAVSELQPYANLWREVEATFSAAFTPRIHALSGSCQTGLDDTILTPPLAFKRPKVSRLTRPGVLFVPSGTRTDKAKLHRAADALPAGFQPLVLGSGGSHPDYPPERFTCVAAEIYGDPLLQAVVSRGGWGTQWECLVNQVPSALVSTNFVEDPEIGHTQHALQQLGLAAVVDESLADFLDAGNLQAYRSRLAAEQQQDLQLFGKLAEDGFAYMAEQIHSRDLMS
jgi:hypothetical protein